MFGSQILEVAVGLILVYLLLSVACSGMKEFIAGITGMRSSTLEAAIRDMLKNPGNATQLLSNHLISAAAGSGAKPSYIPSRSFALAFFDVLAPANIETPRTIEDFRAGVKNLPDPGLQKTILAFFDAAQGNLEKARNSVESWYDDTMERVSGGYKRKAQIIVFCLGLVLCAALNGDTLMVVKELWNDQALRSAVVASAEARVKADSTTQSKETLKQVVADIQQTSTLPIGWSSSKDTVRKVPGGLEEWILKVIGILITAVAITMGAPFWFDMLNKAVNLRLSGDPPKPSSGTVSIPAPGGKS
jgi:hypothetical protein